MRLDRVLPHEQQLVALHGVGQQPLVGFHLVAGGVLHGRQLNRHGCHQRPGALHPRSETRARSPDPAGSGNSSVPRAPVLVSGGLRSLTKTSVAVIGRHLPGANQKRHTRPAPRIHLQTHRGKCLHVGVRIDSRLLPIADETGRAQCWPGSAAEWCGRSSPARRAPSPDTSSSAAPSPDSATTCSMWFCTTSRMAPASS